MEFSEEELEEVMSIFREESEEQIQKLNENLLKLESNPADSAAIQEIFREAHSLKGAARMIGLDDIQSIAHKLEDIFGLARKGEFNIRAEVIDVMCSSVDAIATIIEETVKNKGSTSVDVQAVIMQLKIIEEGGNFFEAATQEEEEVIESGSSDDIKDDEPKITNQVDIEISKEPLKQQELSRDEFSSDEFAELKQIFYAESKNNIEFIHSSIQKLKKYPYDKEALTEVYRIAHALEGSAKIIDFKEIFEITHAIRDIFEQAVKEEIFINADILSTLEKYLKQVENTIKSSFIKDGHSEELSLEVLEKQIEAKMEVYKVKEEKPKKTTKTKVSLSSDAMNIDEKDVLKEFGVLPEEEKAKPKKSVEITKKKLEMDPLSLTDDELGDLELSSLKGIVPVNMPVEESIDKVDLVSKNIVSSAHAFKPQFEDMNKKEKDPQFSAGSLDDLLNYLSDDLNLLSLNANNKNVLSKVKDSVLKIQNIAVSQGKHELLAIITKVSTIFEEVNMEKYPLTEETAAVLSQSIDSVRVMMTSDGGQPEEIIEDPSMIYQRLVILHQTLKLSAGLPFEIEPELEIFAQPPQEKHSVRPSKFVEEIIEEKLDSKPEVQIPQVQESEPPEEKLEIHAKELQQAEKPLEKPPEKLIEKIVEKPEIKIPPKQEEKIDKVATIPFKQQKPAPMLSSKKDISPIGEVKEPSADSMESYTIKTLRVDTRKLDQLVAQVGELIIAKIKAKERLTDIEKLINMVEEWQRDWAKTKYAVKNIEKKPQKSALMAEGTSIYTPGKDMHSIIRENSDTLAQLANHINILYHNIQEDDTRLTLIINELEERIKNVRLLPLTTIFNMFPRMVRDIAREQKKEMELEIYGSETTVDKKIIEEIKSPLMHIIRNSIDHGIEKTEDRLKNGKSNVGKIVLSARHLESSVLIEIIDDGRGINIEAIKEKVLEKELLSQSELEAMTETQIMNIIFWPGFSTGKEVTDISGRGVGMDVVHTKITQLNGKVKVESKLGHGCRVSIQLPVTMATIQVFLVNVAHQTFAIPTSAIKTAVLIKPDDIFFKEGRQTVLVGGVPVFLSKLSDLLELQLPKDEKQKKDKLTVLVLQTDDTNIGFIVDGLLGDQEILHKNLEPPLIRVRNVAGVTTLGSGEVCLILNVGDLIKTAQMNYGMALRSSVQQKELVAKKKDILVVDDSVTTRILERNILRAAGYNVTVAVNGLDALMKLNTQHFDLVVSDVEMPDITGFELVSRIKNDQLFSKIPVVLVTSLASEVDRQKGMTAGASAYITKGGFDQEELLGTIRRLVN